MVYILLADGFEEVETVSPVDALRRAGVEVALVGVTRAVVTGSHGMKLAADVEIDGIDPASCEAIVVPGGLRGVQNIKASEKALGAIKAAYGGWCHKSDLSVVASLYREERGYEDVIDLCEENYQRTHKKGENSVFSRIPDGDREHNEQAGTNSSADDVPV